MTERTCGLGNGNNPLPGDPNMNAPTLMASPAVGGILVSWAYPTLNPHALAYTKVFRSASNEFSTAIQIATATGDSFFNRINTAALVTYFYWIQMVSVNGTEGPVTGPASADLNSNFQVILEMLENKIAGSVLDPALRAKIASITDVSSALSDEAQARLLGDDVLSQLVNDYTDQLNAVDAAVINEISARIAGDSALVTQVNGILVKSEENTAAIVEEQLARANEDEALAASVSQLNATAADNAAAIQNEAAVRANADSSIALNVNTLQATANNLSSSIQTLQQVVSGPDGLTAQYMVKTDVNGYVSGYGLYNDGSESSFVFLADNFAIGKPGAPGVYPFILGTVNGSTRIVLNAPTMIADAAVGTLKIAGDAITVPQSAAVGQSGANVAQSPTIRVSIMVDFGADSSAWPGSVLVMGTGNWLSNGGYAGGAGHLGIAEGNTTSGRQGEVGVSLNGSSYAATAVTMFGPPSTRYMYYSLVSWVDDISYGSHRWGAHNIVVLGAKR